MKRSYTMGARAQAVEETRKRIIEALFGLSRERMFPEISLDDVGQAAGVSVQTILRHFGNRDALVEATMDHAIATVAEERATPVGEVDAAMRVLLDHYELRGSTALLMLAQETADPQIASITQRGRTMHRSWVAEVFAPYVGADDVLVDLLVVATDVYTWKLLRHDLGLSRSQTEQRMKTLVRAVLAGTEKAG